MLGLARTSARRLSARAQCVLNSMKGFAEMISSTKRIAPFALLCLTLAWAALMPQLCLPAGGAAAAAQLSTAALTKEIVGKVVSVADGDTVTVLDATNVQHRIRLTGIDAPESSQAFGTRSRQHLADLVFGKQVTVQYEKNDRYGRTLGKVIAEGRDVCLEQLRAGLAWHYKYYENEQPPADRQTYAQAEVEARAAKRGLWADANPIPPWDFRHGRRGATDGAGHSTDSGAARSVDRVAAESGEQPRAQTVFVTRTGTKYHRPGCQYLRRSSIPLTLTEAKRRHYTPCSICRPPARS